MSQLPIHYRYRDAICEEGFLIVEEKFYPIRETNCFYWVLPEWLYNLHSSGVDNAEHAKRVSKSGIRRKCYPCKQQAFESYKARKASQYHHANHSLNMATYAIINVKDFETLNSSPVDIHGNRVFGKPDFMKDFIFE